MSKNKGVRRYFATEVPNLHLSGSGFKIVEVAASITNNRLIVTAEDNEIFIGIQCIDNKGKVEARSYPPIGKAKSDDIALNGTYAASTSASTNYLTMVNGDIIYGRFDKVAFYEAGGSDTGYYKLIIGGR